MSNLTYANWQEFVAELIESHEKHCCSTRDPIWMVQEKTKVFGLDSDYSDEYKWIDDDSEYSSALDLFNDQSAHVKHEINGFALDDKDELFEELSDEDQEEVLDLVAANLNYNWSKVYYKEEWVSIQTFLTRHDADRFIVRQGHNYGELRVYVESTWRSPQLRDVIQAILDGELKLVKGGAV
ncbi:MAG TPA: hypothetical protein EYM92_04185 [Acinetobacter pittii]|nr:hypothetical protein [Acinetobacter pittii]